MSRPTEFFKEDELVYWDISIYDADGTALDADSNPTVEFRVHGNDTLKTGGVTVTKPAGTTGLYRVAQNLASDSDLSLGASVRYQETATIAGVAYVNRWSTIIRAEPAHKNTQDDMDDLLTDIDVATTNIESKTSQLTFTVANQVDANALTGGTSAADIYTYFTTGTNEDAFKADVSLLSLQSTLTSTASDITAIKGKTDQFVFTVANQVDANALTGGGGDDAATIYTYFTDANREDAFKADSTLAKQNEILAKLSTTTQVFTDPDMANPRKISIIRGDAYDSVSWPAKSWDIGRDIDGLTFRFTIKDQIDGNVIFQSTGTGVGQVAAPVITSSQSLLLEKTEVGDEYYWDVEIEYTPTSFGTPLYGTVEVVDDVTTPGDRS